MNEIMNNMDVIKFLIKQSSIDFRDMNNVKLGTSYPVITTRKIEDMRTFIKYDDYVSIRFQSTTSIKNSFAGADDDIVDCRPWIIFVKHDDHYFMLAKDPYIANQFVYYDRMSELVGKFHSKLKFRKYDVVDSANIAHIYEISSDIITKISWLRKLFNDNIELGEMDYYDSCDQYNDMMNKVLRLNRKGCYVRLCCEIHDCVHELIKLSSRHINVSNIDTVSCLMNPKYTRVDPRSFNEYFKDRYSRMCVK